jgi:hypothetical protein
MDTSDGILCRGGLRDAPEEHRLAGCGIAFMHAAFEGNVGEHLSRSTSGIVACLRRGKND